MQKSLLLARANIRKAKSQTVVIFVLILLASIMLNLWLMLSIDYKQNFKRNHDRLNAEHFSVCLVKSPEETSEAINAILSADERTDEFEINEFLTQIIEFKSNGNDNMYSAVLLSKSVADSKTVGQIEYVEESGCTSGIYIPIIYKSEETAIGNTVEFKLGKEAREYVICGYINSVMMGSNNCVYTEYILSDDKYTELKESGIAPVSTLCSVRIDDPEKDEEYQVDLCSALKTEFPDTGITYNIWSEIAVSRYVSQSICSVIICVMALLTILITVIVIMSNISNYIQENMRNFGALKAVGYTSRQLILSILTQFLSVTVISAIIGTALSYVIFPPLNDMMVEQTGIPYEVTFMPLPVIISFAILMLVVTLTVILSAKKLSKTETITALRMGVKTHSFKKNHLPLEQTKAPINLALALKTTISNMKQNFVTAVTMLMISLLIVFSCLMYHNVIGSIEPMMNLVVGEYADASVVVKKEAAERFIEATENDERVDKVYYYQGDSIQHEDGTGLYCNIHENSDDLSNQGAVYKGRFPKYDNEIAINGTYACVNNLEIGDEITLCNGENKAKYIITGFNQGANSLGKDCLMTKAGHEKLQTFENYCYYVELKDTDDIEKFIEDVSSQLGDDVVQTINQYNMISTADVYVTLITVIVIAIIVLSIIIIAFVLYLLVKTLLNKKKQDYGILKSLGYTTRQIVIQTALSFMPAIVISTAIGITVSCFVINPLLSFYLSNIGIVKSTFTVPYVLCGIVGAIIVVISFLIACMLSRRVRKIAPRELLVNE